MSIQKLERVMWRLRKRHPGRSKVTNLQLRRAIMYDCGTDPLTYRNNRKALMVLGWIKKHKTKQVILTNKDLSGDS